ncbi:hypothetical protein [Mycobacterium antarcticum]|uniref:hypothetical protein n=1 Tax=Mycolicibacterium sp. TUM20984 TaxID=3023368 RepID=UPI00238768F3|nr:hypothetical protein [Mycolicibacterium sp. TUM20984]GLP80851.1 integral membrane protein [Mycolicibacterium sp. TUM20984]
MSTPTDRLEAESWFLARGLPAVLTQRARLRKLWSRSAPALAGIGTISACLLMVYLLTGSTDVEVDGVPSTAQWFVLVVLLLALPLAFLVGWLVARMATDRARAVASVLSAIVALATPVLLHDLGDVVAASVAVALVVVLTASGLGSVLGWAGRLTLSQLTAMGDLLVGALPVVLLTVLVFFNSPVWVMASTISRERLWVAVAFLVLIAATFVVSRLLNRARPTLETATVSPRHAERLEGTPFETLPDLAAPERLTRLERANVVFVLAATQMAQILMVAIVTGIIFLMLGLIVLSPELLALWTRNGPSEGTVFGMTIPVPQALIHVTMFLGALTFMYVSARAVVDTEYRERFLDPLIDDLKLTLLARNRYRAHVRALGGG